MARDGTHGTSARTPCKRALIAVCSITTMCMSVITKRKWEAFHPAKAAHLSSVCVSLQSLLGRSPKPAHSSHFRVSITPATPKVVEFAVDVKKLSNGVCWPSLRSCPSPPAPPQGSSPLVPFIMFTTCSLLASQLHTEYKDTKKTLFLCERALWARRRMQFPLFHCSGSCPRDSIPQRAAHCQRPPLNTLHPWTTLTTMRALGRF